MAKPRLEVSIPGSEKHRLAGLGGIWPYNGLENQVGCQRFEFIQIAGKSRLLRRLGFIRLIQGSFNENVLLSAGWSQRTIWDGPMMKNHKVMGVRRTSWSIEINKELTTRPAPLRRPISCGVRADWSPSNSGCQWGLASTVSEILLIDETNFLSYRAMIATVDSSPPLAVFRCS